MQDLDLSFTGKEELALRPELETQRNIWKSYALGSRDLHVSRIRVSFVAAVGHDKASKALQALDESV